MPVPAEVDPLGREEERMTGETWKRQKLEELRARIKIEEQILRALRAELEEVQWLDRKAAEMRCGWDLALTAEEQEKREYAEFLKDIWLLGENRLKIEEEAACPVPTAHSTSN